MSTADLRAAPQHKLGADRTESVAAVPVNERNRTKEIGPVRDIDVSDIILGCVSLAGH